MAENTLRIAIKLKRPDSTPFEPLNGLKVFLEGTGLQNSALQPFSLIESLKPDQLAKLIERARQRDARLEWIDFSRWLQIITPPGIEPEMVVRALRGLDMVETAYVVRPAPPPGSNQGYLDVGPNGIGASAAWNVKGGDGSGIGFVDIEQGWNLNHKDLPAGIQLISGDNKQFHSHGTAVLGQVLMVHNNRQGGLGIAPGATGRVASLWRPSGSYNAAEAICDVVVNGNMAFGDVLLLEAQAFDPVGRGTLLPVEVLDDVFEAICLATANGIVVVEAAANGTVASGAVDLDAYTNIAGEKIFDRTSSDFRDSGAIIVGASSSKSPHRRLGLDPGDLQPSNYGSRIDCYAWGEKVFTAISDAAGTDTKSYTDDFSGTSSASAIVAGAALIVQGLAQASRRGRFSPSDLRQILTTHGTPSADPSKDKIGIMPDLAKIVAIV